MPITGGLPKRITFEDDGIIVGWMPAREIIYRTSLLFKSARFTAYTGQSTDFVTPDHPFELGK